MSRQLESFENTRPQDMHFEYFCLAPPPTMIVLVAGDRSGARQGPAEGLEEFTL